jgi:hypothetical protein
MQSRARNDSRRLGRGRQQLARIHDYKGLSRRVVPRPTFAVGVCLLFVQLRFAADFGRGWQGSSLPPAKAKQEMQMLGFSERRVIGSPQQTQTRGAYRDLGFINSK